MKYNYILLTSFFACSCYVNAQDTGLEDLSETVRELQGRLEKVEQEIKELKESKVSNENAANSANILEHNSPEQIEKMVQDFLEQNEMEKARNLISAFVDKNPTSIYRGRLLFYAGQSYFVEKDYKNAAIKYMEGFKANPTGAKSAETLFKLASCFKHLSKIDKCKSILQKIITDYPGEFAKKAQKELKQLQ